MPNVVLAPALARWLSPDGTGRGAPVRVQAKTLREALESLFVLHPVLRGYVVDEGGALRHHVVAFVDGVAIDKRRLETALGEGSEVFLFQALSGG